MKVDPMVDRDVARQVARQVGRQGRLDAIVTTPCWQRVKAWTGDSWLRYDVWEALRDEVDLVVWRVKWGVKGGVWHGGL